MILHIDKCTWEITSRIDTIDYTYSHAYCHCVHSDHWRMSSGHLHEAGEMWIKNKAYGGLPFEEFLIKLGYGSPA